MIIWYLCANTAIALIYPHNNQVNGESTRSVCWKFQAHGLAKVSSSFLDTIATKLSKKRKRVNLWCQCVYVNFTKLWVVMCTHLRLIKGIFRFAAFGWGFSPLLCLLTIAHSSWMCKFSIPLITNNPPEVVMVITVAFGVQTWKLGAELVTVKVLVCGQHIFSALLLVSLQMTFIQITYSDT